MASLVDRHLSLSTGGRKERWDGMGVWNKEVVDWSHLSLIKQRQWVLEAQERLPTHRRDLAYLVRQQG